MKTRKVNPAIIAKYSHSTHAPYKCKDCEYLAKSQAALNMHWNRKHGLVVVPNQELMNKTDEELIPNGFELATVAKPKRKWTRRTVPQEQPTLQQFKQVNFCPCCGTNMQAVSVALSLS